MELELLTCEQCNEGALRFVDHDQEPDLLECTKCGALHRIVEGSSTEQK